ncbi:alpha-D-ribose 1-methylphosphonate 5-triphosphate diphosphatase [Agromyces cerinus]|uniref:Alpha-D-ribose 1-methylphosphonate 5-triphosphate diphosphatase n=1 Tax=Agromyces cerinus subsp. cerinus TaxID=232089 RepID=A0A1N6ESB3_9MICO|nr:alpha-D-ribose 1-methylphosphonate 5-triphosphate diphosphatase [Agromyces cerinus]SIN85841.1 alpha-D-ribose 1-methylphosphonate 5-triphosphate diphosphatase [Agromyces cerinus subsp. cerinus]
MTATTTAAPVTRADAAGWPLGRPPADYVLGHVRAVLPDRILDDARIVVRAGIIEEVAPHPPGGGADLDGGDAMCLPGLVDVHGDALGRELRPRPGASVPVGYALAAAEGRLRAAGTTTAFQGVAFQSRTAVGLPIGSPPAEEIADAIEALDASAMRILHRVDVRCAAGVAALEARVAAAGDAVLVVSHEDHTPGQGQYADPSTMRRWMVEGEGMTPDEASAHVEWWRDSRDEQREVGRRTLARLGGLARAGRIRLFGHDPATRDDVDQLVERGGAVAEFPTTFDAAAHARRRGLLVVAGAPNAMRGGSHAGNVSAGELISAGLVDALASDYLPDAQLGAVVRLVAGGSCSLPAAVGLVTSGPAAAVGLTDRGSLVPGLRADLVLADLDGTWPRVLATLTA